MTGRPTRRDLITALVDSLQKAFPLDEADVPLTHADLTTVLTNLEAIGSDARVPYDATFTLHDESTDDLVMAEAMAVLRRLTERGLANAADHGVILLVTETVEVGNKVDVASNLGAETIVGILQTFLESGVRPKFTIDDDAPIKH